MTATTGDARLDAIARLVVREGLNVQPQQPVIIQAPVEARRLVRQVVQAAYDAGAGLVQCHYDDPELLRIAVASLVPQGLRPGSWSAPVAALAASQPTAARLCIVGPRPRLMQGIATEQLLRFHQLCGHLEALAEGETATCTLPFATRDWATWIRPQLEAKVAQDALWEDILHLCGSSDALSTPAEESPRQRTGRVVKLLNRLALVSLRFSGPATDLRVELLPSARWCGGVKYTAAGIPYLPTLPPGPMQCLLQGSGTLGVLSVRQPVTIGATSVCDLKLEFNRGRVSRLHATQGSKVLEQLMTVDANARRLGQVGLVDTRPAMGMAAKGFLAPIMDKACGVHLTLGCPPDGIHQPGANRSDLGIDLMLDDAALEIDGVDAHGKTVRLFREGRCCL